MSDILRSIKAKLLDEGGIAEIFSHVRNLLVATLVIAAGAYAIRQEADVEVFGVLSLQIAGLGVAAIGLILVGLNLLDGLYKLTKVGSPLALRVGLLALYLFVALRLIQFTVLLRAG
jgi:hypothetical protein